MSLGLSPLGLTPLGTGQTSAGNGNSPVVLVGAASTQAGTSPGAAVTQTHVLVGLASTQSSTSGTGGAGENHIAVGAPSFQSSSSSGGSIVQGHTLGGSACTQASASPAGELPAPAVGQPVGAGSAQAATSPAGAITQGHVLVAAPSSSQGASSSNGAIGQAHVLIGAPSLQASTSGVGVIGEQHIAMGAPSFQSSTSTSGRVIQFQRPLGAASTQGSTSPGAAAVQEIGGVPREVTGITVEAPTRALSEYQSMQLDVEVTVTGGASTDVIYKAALGTITPSGIYTAPPAVGRDQTDIITITPVAGKSLAVTIEVIVRAGLFDSWGRRMTLTDEPDILAECKEITEQQAESGDYPKDRYQLYGLPIAIESPRGSVRHWKAADGTRGSHVMTYAYGYIEGTLGNDGDELDCTIGPAPLNAELAYVVNQFIDGKFDEHKIMFGFANQAEAEAGYLTGYTKGWSGLRDCVPCSITQLKWWIANGDKAQPIEQQQLPHEGTNEMEKVLWDSANMPLHSNLEQVLYRLRAHDGDNGLLFDAVSIADILADADGVLTLDALVIPFARIEQRMMLLQKVLDRVGGAVKVAAMQVSDPFTQRGTTNVAVVYELTDGQTLSIFFHNPDVTPKKIAPGDDLISWKWMLNKKDVTVAVAPEKGRDLDVRTVAARIMKLAEKNSERFVKANTNRAAKLETISSLKTELETKQATLAELEGQIEAARAQRDAEGLDDPVDPVPPTPNPQPQLDPEPAPAPSLDVDGMWAVVTSSDPMPGVSRGADWIVLNGTRPLMGTETLSNGEFLSGRFYAAIDPSDSMAGAYLDEDRKLGGKVVFVADKATLTKMALNTISPEYVAAYAEMDDATRERALSGFIDNLNTLTYGRLKALAAMDEPVPDFWKRDVEQFGFNRPGFFGRALGIMGASILSQQPAGTWTVAKLESGKFVACFATADSGWSYAAESDTIEQAYNAMLENEQYQAAITPQPDLEAEKAAAEKAAAEAEAARQAEEAAQAAREAEAAAAAEKAAKEAQEAEEAADGDFLALAAAGDVDFYDKAVTDRLAALAKKYTDPEGAYLDMILRAKTAAKNFFIAEFKKKVG